MEKFDSFAYRWNWILRALKHFRWKWPTCSTRALTANLFRMQINPSTTYRDESLIDLTANFGNSSLKWLEETEINLLGGNVQNGTRWLHFIGSIAALSSGHKASAFRKKPPLAFLCSSDAIGCICPEASSCPRPHTDIHIVRKWSHGSIHFTCAPLAAIGGTHPNGTLRPQVVDGLEVINLNRPSLSEGTA